MKSRTCVPAVHSASRPPSSERITVGTSLDGSSCGPYTKKMRPHAAENRSAASAPTTRWTASLLTP
jgi:hypothetical protein